VINLLLFTLILNSKDHLKSNLFKLRITEPLNGFYGETDVDFKFNRTIYDLIKHYFDGITNLVNLLKLYYLT